MLESVKCPRCGHQIESLAEPTERRETDLLMVCKERGYHVTADQRVSEAVAAELLGRSPRTVAHWAHEGSGPAFVRVRNRRTYRIGDLALLLSK